MSTAHCALLGMDLQTRYTYEYFFRTYGDGRYFLAADSDSANVLLIDVDTHEGRRIAHQDLAGDDGAKITVLISANEAHPDKVLTLRKPVAPAALRAVLEKAIGQLINRSLRTTSAPPPAVADDAAPRIGHDSSGKVAGVALAMDDEDFNHYMFRFDGSRSEQQETFEPEHYLYGGLRRAWQLALQTGHQVELRWELPAVRVCPASRRAATAMSDRVLRSIAVSRMKYDIVELDDAAAWPTTLRSEPVDQLLWRLAVWTSRGRLPAGFDRHAAVSLRHWPNLTRLLPTPHAMQIAALWTAGQWTLADTAKRLMTSTGDVHASLCAADAIRLLSIDAAPAAATQNRPVAAPAPATAAPPQPATAAKAAAPGLLSRILGRILSLQSSRGNA